MNTKPSENNQANLMPQAIKLSVNLSPEVVQDIREMAAKRNVAMTQVIRDAIGTLDFITTALDQRSKFLLKSPGRRNRLILFQ